MFQTINTRNQRAAKCPRWIPVHNSLGPFNPHRFAKWPRKSHTCTIYVYKVNQEQCIPDGVLERIPTREDRASIDDPTIHARDTCTIVWHSQNLATAICDSVCQTLDPFSQSREPPGHSRYRDDSRDSIDFNRTPRSQILIFDPVREEENILLPNLVPLGYLTELCIMFDILMAS